MGRLLVLLSLCAGLGAFGVVACGGSDKPPLTPDSIENIPGEVPEAGAPSAVPPRSVK